MTLSRLRKVRGIETADAGTDDEVAVPASAYSKRDMFEIGMRAVERRFEYGR